VKQWLIDAYKSLVLDKTGSDLLGLGDNGVDASTIAKLFYIREQLKPQIGNSTISTVSYSYCSYCQNHRNFNHVVLDPQQVLNKINEVFASELTEMEASSLNYSIQTPRLTLACTF
jgi:hypothetical protein